MLPTEQVERHGSKREVSGQGLLLDCQRCVDAVVESLGGFIHPEAHDLIVAVLPDSRIGEMGVVPCWSSGIADFFDHVAKRTGLTAENAEHLARAVAEHVAQLLTEPEKVRLSALLDPDFAPLFWDPPQPTGEAPGVRVGRDRESEGHHV